MRKALARAIVVVAGGKHSPKPLLLLAEDSSIRQSHCCCWQKTLAVATIVAGRKELAGGIIVAGRRQSLEPSLLLPTSLLADDPRRSRRRCWPKTSPELLSGVFEGPAARPCRYRRGTSPKANWSALSAAAETEDHPRRSRCPACRRSAGRLHGRIYCRRPSPEQPLLHANGPRRSPEVLACLKARLPAHMGVADLIAVGGHYTPILVANHCH